MPTHERDFFGKAMLGVHDAVKAVLWNGAARLEIVRHSKHSKRELCREVQPASFPNRYDTHLSRWGRARRHEMARAMTLVAYGSTCTIFCHEGGNASFGICI